MERLVIEILNSFGISHLVGVLHEVIRWVLHIEAEGNLRGETVLLQEDVVEPDNV
jgi:hypothetical protein